MPSAISGSYHGLAFIDIHPFGSTALVDTDPEVRHHANCHAIHSPEYQIFA